MADSTPSAPPPARKPLSSGMVLVLSLALVCVSPVIEQPFRWTDRWQGFMSGLHLAPLFAVVWLVPCVPWILAVRALYRRRGWQRHRAFWMMVPAMSVPLFLLAGLAISPPTAGVRFRTTVESELPDNARDLRKHFTGSGIGGFHDLYTFETTPDQVDRLIAEMKLSEAGIPWTAGSPGDPIGLPGWPDLRGSDGARRYQGSDDQRIHTLVTDRTRTRVFVSVHRN